MPAPVRLLIPLDSHDPKAWALAVGYAEKFAEQSSPAVREVILLTHAKDQLQRTSLAGHMGEPAAKALLARRTLSMPSGLPLRHATLQTLRGSGRGAVVIAYYANDAMLETLDGIDGVAGIVAVPWIPDQVSDWVSRWNPQVHGQPPAPPAPLITDPVVEKAFASLTGMINLGHGILHPRDKQHADETLRILRAKGHTLEPAKIKSWAIRNNWKPGAADVLAKLAERVAKLKSKPSLRGYHDPNARYANWL